MSHELLEAINDPFVGHRWCSQHRIAAAGMVGGGVALRRLLADWRICLRLSAK
jgi:hypothetical protein